MSPSTVSLGEVAHSIVDGPFGSNLKTSDYVEAGIPVLQGKNITGDQFAWKEVRYITPAKAKELARSSVEIGDHLVVKIGSIGYSAIIDNLNGHAFAIIPANLARIRPNRGRIDDRYLHHWLTSDDAKRYFVRVASKTAQPALSLAKIKQARLPLPPLDEQQRIAAILDNADALRRKRKRAIDLLDSVTQSIFLEMFGDPVSNSKGWPEKPLAAYETFLTSGSRGWAKYYSDTGRAFIRIQNLRNGDLSTEDLIYVDPPDDAEARRTTVQTGDILISITADLGRTAVVPSALHGQAHINQHIALVRSQGIEPTYLSTYLASKAGKLQFDSLNRQGVKAGLNFDNIRSLRILEPPREMQEKYVAKRNAAGIITAKLKSQITAFDSLFSSLQHRAFSCHL